LLNTLLGVFSQQAFAQAGCTNTQTTYISGDFVYFTLEFKNNGTATADNVAIVDRHDPELQFDSIHSESNPGLIGDPHVNIGILGHKISFSDGFSLTP
jgi:uncharacterized repeat protein (TIGR01451 family)